MQKVMTALAKMVAVFGIMAVSSWALYMEYVRKNDQGIGEYITMDDFEKKKELFLKQKETMDTFLRTGAISQMQYDKSYGDLVKKMGMESVAEEISEAEK